MGYKKNKSRRLLYISLICLPLLGILLWGLISSPTPSSAFETAQRLASEGRFGKAQVFFEIAKRDPHLQPWATLGLAKTYEREKNKKKALSLYASIAVKSAASLDARLAVLRLRYFEPSETTEALPRAQLGNVIGALEKDLIGGQRLDLLGELHLLKAKSALQSGELELAFSLLNDMRRQFAGEKYGRQARKALEMAREKYQLPEMLSSIAAMKEEALRLKLEGELDAAFRLLGLAKEKTKADSPAFLELSLVEEQILRSQNMHSKADAILAEVAAANVEGISDTALYAKAKKAWNINKHHQALEILNSLRRRFPNSEHIPAASYIEGRILEEMNLLTEAKDAFQAAAEHENQPTLVARALRQQAWLHIQSQNDEEAVISFAKLEKYVQQTLNGRSIPSLTKVEHESLTENLWHARYWRAIVQHRSGKMEEATETLSQIKEESGSGYYGWLAANFLGSRKSEVTTPVHQGGLKKDAVGERLQTPPLREEYTLSRIPRPSSKTEEREALKASCFPSLSKGRQDLFSRLQMEKLKTILLKELNWYMYRAKKETATDTVSSYSQHAKLYAQFGFVHQALSMASLGVTNKEHPCFSLLFQLSFPLPFRKTYEQVAAEQGVSLALLYAISRTESHFKQDAVSSAGARGIMQLMPATALKEGVRDADELFKPQINIAAGTAHIARLIRLYADEKIYAIAAYNAGGAAVNRWRSRYPEVSPSEWVELIGYPETKNYVKKVLLAEARYHARLNQEKNRENRS